tara:strand:+ start:1082 stop:1675 length:594 start_codon:yes stop_codon:yes gene_type:complete
VIKLIDNNLQKFFIFFLILMFSSVLSLSSRNKSVLSDGEKNILKNLRITPANIWLKANDFSALDSSGLTVSLNDFKGKFVLLNFWATWCYPCLKEMPDLEKAYQNLGEEKLAIVAVAMGENVAKINKFSKKNNFTFPLLSDENMEITKLYGVKNIPVTFLIDSNGLVLGRAIGIRDWSSPKLMGFIKSRLKKFKQKI